MRAGDAAAEAPPLALQPLAGDVTFRADKLETDGRLRDFTLEGGVVVRYGRYRVESDAIRISIVPDGINVDGDASLALCPCPDPPITFAFSGGSASKEGDVELWFPRVRLLGVPVFALPWLWIRAPKQVGLLPPSFEWLGSDGLRIGTGVHLPWEGEAGASEPRVIDATIAGYIKGGVTLGARVLTPTSTTKLTWDWIRGGRVEALALGHNADVDEGETAVAWEADAILGQRALSGTVDLRSAALPYNTAGVEISKRAGFTGRELSALFATGVSARGWRGEAGGLGDTNAPIAGPRASIFLGGALTPRGSWDASVDAGVLGDIDGVRALSYAEASAGASMTVHPGPLELRFSAREQARVADGGSEGSAAGSITSARVSLRFPLARNFGGPIGEAPLVHVITPGVEARAAAVVGDGDYVEEARWSALAGLSTSLGRYTGSAFRADIRAGILGAGEGVTHTAAQARAALGGPLFSGEILAAAAREGESVADFIDGISGFAFLGRARLGPVDSVYLRVHVAAGLGQRAGVARLLDERADSLLRVSTSVGYLATDGWSGGAELSIPWSRAVRSIVRADADITAPRLLAAKGSIHVAHPCGCFALVASGGYRLGRGGPDLALALDLAPPRAAPSTAW